MHTLYSASFELAARSRPASLQATPETSSSSLVEHGEEEQGNGEAGRIKGHQQSWWPRSAAVDSSFASRGAGAVDG